MKPAFFFPSLELQGWMKKGFIFVAVFTLKPEGVTWYVEKRSQPVIALWDQINITIQVKCVGIY